MADDKDRVNLTQGMLKQALLVKALRDRQIEMSLQQAEGGAPPQAAPAGVPPGQGQLSPLGARPDPRATPQAQAALAQMLRQRQMPQAMPPQGPAPLQ